MSNACFSPLFMLSMSPRNAVLLKCPWNRTLDAAWICACFAELSAEEMSNFILNRCAACTLSNLWVLMFLSNSLYVLFSIVFKVWWRVPRCFSASSHDTTDVSEMWSCTLSSPLLLYIQVVWSTYRRCPMSGVRHRLLWIGGRTV